MSISIRTIIIPREPDDILLFGLGVRLRRIYPRNEARTKAYTGGFGRGWASGPVAQEPTRKGIGGRIIEQMIVQQKGKVRFDWPSGVFDQSNSLVKAPISRPPAFQADLAVGRGQSTVLRGVGR
jgi:hypothetical protein